MTPKLFVLSEPKERREEGEENTNVLYKMFEVMRIKKRLRFLDRALLTLISASFFNSRAFSALSFSSCALAM